MLRRPVAITSDGQVYFTGSSRDVVAAYEISITDGNYTGRLNLLFNLGSKYDGKTYTIYHEKKSGEIEKYTAVCTEGKVAIAIDELSPFLITIAVQADSDNVIPQTGDNSNLFSWVILAALSAITLMLVLVHGRNKRNKFSN